MLVKESGDLALQLSRVTQLTHGNGVCKEFALDICGQIILLHNDCGSQAPQNVLLFLGQPARDDVPAVPPLGAPPSLSHPAIALF